MAGRKADAIYVGILLILIVNNNFHERLARGSLTKITEQLRDIEEVSEAVVSLALGNIRRQIKKCHLPNLSDESCANFLQFHYDNGGGEIDGSEDTTQEDDCHQAECEEPAMEQQEADSLDDEIDEGELEDEMETESSHEGVDEDGEEEAEEERSADGFNEKAKAKESEETVAMDAERSDDHIPGVEDVVGEAEVAIERHQENANNAGDGAEEHREDEDHHQEEQGTWRETISFLLHLASEINDLLK